MKITRIPDCDDVYPLGHRPLRDVRGQGRVLGVMDIGPEFPEQLTRAEDVVTRVRPDADSVDHNLPFGRVHGFGHRDGDPVPACDEVAAEAARGEPESAGGPKAQEFAADQTNVHVSVLNFDPAGP